MRQPQSILARSARTVVVTVAAALVASEILLGFLRAGADRRRLATGAAHWIWATRDLPEPAPLRFVASKEFSLPGPPSRAATARIFVDRAYVLSINGVRVGSGGQESGDSLDVFALPGRLRQGRNQISIEVSSPNGAGGILFWLDPGEGRPIVSDRSWEIEGTPSAPGENSRHAIEWGRPPMYPWSYPPLPRASSRVRVSGGTAAAIRAPSPARAATQ